MPTLSVNHSQKLTVPAKRESKIDDSSIGELIVVIINSIKHVDNDVRSERTVAGMKARLEQGGWTFPPALGYLKSRDSKNRNRDESQKQSAHLDKFFKTMNQHHN